MKERVVIIFFALVIGLLITTFAFYLYRSSQAGNPVKNISLNNNKNTEVKKEKGENFLTINTPLNESISTTRTVKIEGKTLGGNTIVISSNADDLVLTAPQNGSFSTTVDIDTGANKIITRSITADGKQVIDERMITYSNDEF